MVVVSVKSYRRKGKAVSGYKRNQRSNRGKFGNKLRSGGTKTYWLKGSRGRFVGRANSRGQTSASNILRRGIDDTGVWREGKEGRIIGRY